MSLFGNNNITCPNCKKEGMYQTWDSINVDLNPEMREKVMDGTLFYWTCPHCGKTYMIPYPFLYHDMTHKLMIMYDPKTPLILFGENIRQHECGLNEMACYSLKAEYTQNHPDEQIVFAHLAEDKSLCYAIWHKTDGCWDLTDRQYSIPYEEYEKRIDATPQEEEHQE